MRDYNTSSFCFSIATCSNAAPNTRIYTNTHLFRQIHSCKCPCIPYANRSLYIQIIRVCTIYLRLADVCPILCTQVRTTHTRSTVHRLSKERLRGLFTISHSGGEGDHQIHAHVPVHKREIVWPRASRADMQHVVRSNSPVPVIDICCVRSLFDYPSRVTFSPLRHLSPHA